MSVVDSTKGVMNYTLNCSLKVVDKAIKMIPPDKLDWKPVEDAMTISELALHIYHMAYTYTWGTKNGKVTASEFIDMTPPQKVSRSEEIIEYGQKVKEYMNETIPSLTEENLTSEVVYHCWNDFKIVGRSSILTINEEVIHHRGQLSVYLRMLGVKPPFIYDFS
ncbi:MAG: DinB family protein [Candidatus Hodarchaeales archaeon]